MKLILLLMASLVLSCSSDLSENDLGEGFTVKSVREGVKIVYLDQRRIMRGGINILFFDENVIVGNINMEGDEFSGDRGIFDRPGYFVIDKRKKAVFSMEDGVDIKFP